MPIVNKNKIQQAELLLFTDFDGVLHPIDAAPTEKDCLSNRISDNVFSVAGHLKETLCKLPNAYIVATTGWRLPFLDCRTGQIDEGRFWQAVESRLPGFLLERMIGITPFVPAIHARHKEILQFCVSTGTAELPRVILDDHDIYYKRVELMASEAVVICDGKFGLTASSIEELNAAISRVMPFWKR